MNEFGTHTLKDIKYQQTSALQTPLSWQRVVGHAQWRKGWLKVSSELAQDRRAWSASVRDVVNTIGDAGSIRPE